MTLPQSNTLGLIAGGHVFFSILVNGSEVSSQTTPASQALSATGEGGAPVYGGGCDPQGPPTYGGCGKLTTTDNTIGYTFTVPGNFAVQVSWYSDDDVLLATSPELHVQVRGWGTQSCQNFHGRVYGV